MSTCRLHGRIYCGDAGNGRKIVGKFWSQDVETAFDVAKTFRRIEVFILDRSSCACGGGLAGGDEGRDGICLLRELRDHVSLF